MMAKAITPVLKDFKQENNNTNDRLNRQYRMMTKAHDRYNRLFRRTNKTFQIHHLALLMVVVFLYFPVNIREYSRLSGRSKTSSHSKLIDKHSVKVINPFYSRLIVVDHKSLYKCVTITPCNNAVIDHL